MLTHFHDDGVFKWQLLLMPCALFHQIQRSRLNFTIRIEITTAVIFKLYSIRNCEVSLRSSSQQPPNVQYMSNAIGSSRETRQVGPVTLAGSSNDLAATSVSFIQDLLITRNFTFREAVDDNMSVLIDIPPLARTFHTHTLRSGMARATCHSAAVYLALPTFFIIYSNQIFIIFAVLRRSVLRVAQPISAA